MNIVFLLRPWPVYGGGESVTIALANEMVKREMSVSILYTKDVCNKKPPYIDSKIQAIKVPNIKSDEHSKSFSKEEKKYANSFLKEFVRSHNIDIVISQWWPAECLKGVKELCGVITCLHMSLFLPSNYNNIKWLSKSFYKKMLGERLYFKCHCISRCKQVEEYLPYVDKYVFLSDSFKKDYLNFRNGINESKLEYCYNPLPFNSFITDDELKEKENIVLYVGRMYDSHKNVSMILDVWRSIEDVSSFDSWKLVLVGDGPDKNKFENKARLLNLQRISFEGYQLPEKYYKKAKIFVMTSNHEGWGMTLVESQMNGVVPIVLDTFSSSHEIIKDGFNGKLIKYGDFNSYVNNLKLLMTDESRLKNMAISGIDTCKRFSVENIVDKWTLIFNQILKDK